MPKTPKTTPAKVTAPKTPAKVIAKNSTKKATTPKRAASKVLAGIELKLPSSPTHHYGSQRNAITLTKGDIIYMGDRHNLSRLRVLSVEDINTKGATPTVRIIATALSLFLNGVEYVNGEQVVLVGPPHSRVAVQTYFP